MRETPQGEEVRGGLIVFYVSTLLGVFSHAMFIYGLVVLVTDRAHSTTLTSLAYFMAFFTMAIMTPARALRADQEPKIPLLRRCQVGMAVAVLFLALLVWMAGEGAAVGVGATILAGLYGYASAGIAGTRMALLPQIVRNVAGPTMVVQTMITVAFSIGPLLYAELRAATDDSIAMGGVALLLLGSALSLPRLIEAAKKTTTAGPNVWVGTAETVEHFRDVDLLWQALLLGTIPALLVLGPIQAVLPKMMTLSFPGDERFRAAFFGLMGAGLFLGSTLSLAHIGRSAHRKMLVGLFAIVAGATLVAIPFVPSKVIFSGLALLCGIGLGVPSAVVPVLLQEGTNNVFRSRVMNTNTLRVTLVPAVGAVLCGALSDGAGAKLSIALFGAVSVAVTGAVLVAIRRSERISERRASSLL
jgi:hypothetical protein